MPLLRERREGTEARVVAEVPGAGKDLAEEVDREVVAEAEGRLAAGEAGGSCGSR
jgi:hypothetical protein